MALHRGIQSAIFYYISCAPCADAKYRKRRKREAQIDRANREALAMEQPDLYRHPSPSSTNPYWQTEIAEGPMGTRKKRVIVVDSQTRLKTTATLSSNGSAVPSTVDLSPMAGRDGKYEKDTPPMRYQRPDEELWGESAMDLSGPGKSNGSILTRPSTARTATSNKSYQADKNPALNDYHPATTRKITSKDEVAWMLQPPPVADVMKGTMRPLRTRSDSGGSRPSAGSAQPLSRQVSQRIVEEKIRAGEIPPTMAGAIAKSASAESLGSRRQNRPPPILFSSSDGLAGAAASTQHGSYLAPEDANSIFYSQHHARGVALKPDLSPIPSHSSTPGMENVSPASMLGRTKSAGHQSEVSYMTRQERRPNTAARHPSLDMLAHPTGPSSSKTLATSPTLFEAQIRVPAHDDGEDSNVEVENAELFDSWYTPDFDLSSWVKEHTKREVRQRWSMDL